MCQELGIWWLFCFEITYHAKTFEKSRQHFHPLETIGNIIVINILSYNGCVISETPTRCGAGACITAFTPTERHRPPLSLPRSSSEVASAWCRPRFLHSWVVRASLRWGVARHSSDGTVQRCLHPRPRSLLSHRARTAACGHRVFLHCLMGRFACFWTRNLYSNTRINQCPASSTLTTKFELNDSCYVFWRSTRWRF